MRKRFLSLVLAGAMAATVFTGCGQTEVKESESAVETSAETGAASEETKEETKEEAKAKDGETREFTDSCGRTVEIPSEISKIAVSGKMAQMYVLAVAPDKMVGLANPLKGKMAKVYGEKITSLPIFGAFYGKGDLNKEAVAAADPQLIIDVGEAKKKIVEDMDNVQKEIGIPVVHIEANLENTGDAFRTLGELLGKEEKASLIAEYCDNAYQTAIDYMSEIPEDKRVNFIYLQGENGLNAIAKDSFHAQVLNIFGNNVCDIENPSSKGSGDEVSTEQILKWNPNFIIFAPAAKDAADIYDNVKEDPFFSTLEAIKEDKYISIPGTPFNWVAMPPACNRYIGILYLGNKLYPEKFNYNMYDKAKEYFNLFFNYELTEEEYNEIVK